MNFFLKRLEVLDLSENNSCKLILENLLASRKRNMSILEDMVIAHGPNWPRHAD
jgi:hypothetical protein